jgi:hypothetical protein
VLLALAASTPVSAADGDWAFDLGLRMRYDDNIGFAPDKESRRDDLSTRLFGTVGWTPVNDARHTLNFSLTPFYEGVRSLEDLSNWGVILGGSYRYQFSESFTAPWIGVLVEATAHEFEDSELRDGYKAEGEIELGKNFSPKFGGRLGWRYQRRWTSKDFPEGTIEGGESNKVFEQKRNGPFAEVNFSPAPKTTLFFEYQYLDGDVAATGDSRNFQNGTQFPRARDFAFEEGARFLAWRIPVKQDRYTVGWSQILSEKFTFELSSFYQDARSSSGNDYDNWVVIGELNFNF